MSAVERILAAIDELERAERPARARVRAEMRGEVAGLRRALEIVREADSST